MHAQILQGVLTPAELRALRRVMPHRRMRVPWISSLSPSMMLACPVRLAAIAPQVGTRSNHAAAIQCRVAESVRHKAK
jgi:hypothetical protein